MTFVATLNTIVLAGAKPVLVDIDPTTLNMNVARIEGSGGFKLPAEGIDFEQLEKSLLIQAMDQTNWNITRAAKLLGLSFRTMQYRLDKFGLARAIGIMGRTTFSGSA